LTRTICAIETACSGSIQAYFCIRALPISTPPAYYFCCLPEFHFYCCTL